MAGLNTYKSKCYKKAHLQMFSLICLLLSFLFQPISAQLQNLHFHRFSSDDGLPQHTVNCIIQDKHGFMWFGTQDGMARYDGYSFRTYRSEPGNPNSLSNNYIWDIHEDSLGTFWISSFGGGLTRFDPATETFEHFKREESDENSLSNDNTFKSISTGKDVWVCTNDGVSRVNTLNGEVKRLYTKPGTGDGHAGHFTGAIARDKAGVVWIGSDEGLIMHNPDDKNHDIFPETPFGEKMQLQTIRDLRIIDNKLFIITTNAFLNIDFEKEITNVLLKSSKVDSSGQITFQNVYPALDGNFSQP